MPMEGWCVWVHQTFVTKLVTKASDVIKHKKHNMPQYCSCGVIQLSVNPGIQIRDKVIYTKF